MKKVTKIAKIFLEKYLTGTLLVLFVTVFVYAVAIQRILPCYNSRASNHCSTTPYREIGGVGRISLLIFIASIISLVLLDIFKPVWKQKAEKVLPYVSILSLLTTLIFNSFF